MGTTLQWSVGLALDLPLMDRTHEEMVNLLAQVGEADDTALCAAWDLIRKPASSLRRRKCLKS